MQTRRVLLSLATIAALVLPVLTLLETSSMPLAAATTPSAVNHDIYNPARTALVNAQRQLAESSRQEQDILQRTKRMHEELDKSLALLANAGALDPAMKAQIDAVRVRLAALQDRPALCPMDRNSSLTVYEQLVADLQQLIEQY
ncbi:MAG: hypothetical protein H6984_10605 [Pseudomonadales bacterium]|nr:hypothetical protein [Pseudomonadales bacterium]MCP5193847.1 hypothetical protein [Pseudomonadales bacterium]